MCCPVVTITGGRLARSYSTKCFPSRLLSISLLISVKNFVHRIITSTFNTNPSPYLTCINGDLGHIPVCAKTGSTAQNAHPGLLAALSFHSSVVCPVLTHIVYTRICIKSMNVLILKPLLKTLINSVLLTFWCQNSGRRLKNDQT